ncbi:hypothetical protein E2320_014250 [Naja naja]|nr:hypothetical protein E2320_014250 [Naja naja]
MAAQSFSPERLARQLAKAEALLVAHVSPQVQARWRWAVKLDGPPDLERFCTQLREARRGREALLDRDAALSEPEQERLQGLLRLEMALLRAIQALAEGRTPATVPAPGTSRRRQGRKPRVSALRAALLGLAAELDVAKRQSLPWDAALALQLALEALLEKRPGEAIRALEPLLLREGGRGRPKRLLALLQVLQEEGWAERGDELPLREVRPLLEKALRLVRKELRSWRAAELVSAEWAGSPEMVVVKEEEEEEVTPGGTLPKVPGSMEMVVVKEEEEEEEVTVDGTGPNVPGLLEMVVVKEEEEEGETLDGTVPKAPVSKAGLEHRAPQEASAETFPKDHSQEHLRPRKMLPANRRSPFAKETGGRLQEEMDAAGLKDVVPWRKKDVTMGPDQELLESERTVAHNFRSVQRRPYPKEAASGQQAEPDVRLKKGAPWKKIEELRRGFPFQSADLKSVTENLEERRDPPESSRDLLFREIFHEDQSQATSTRDPALIDSSPFSAGDEKAVEHPTQEITFKRTRKAPKPSGMKRGEWSLQIQWK